MGLFRCIIKKSCKEYYTGISYNDVKYKIIKNPNLKELKIGADVSFYAKKEKKLFYNILTPISDEDAGVI